MNKSLYKITAWILIVAGIIYAIANIYYSYNEYFLGVLGSIIILVLSIIPAKFYLAISDEESKQNKLTNTSLILTSVGMAVVIITFLMMIAVPSDGWAWLYGLILGILPAGLLYTIAVILLLINKFKK